MLISPYSVCLPSILTGFDASNRLAAVTAFDWLVTFSDEIRLMWSRRMTGAKVLFLLNRYLWMISTILQVMLDLWAEPDNAVNYLLTISDMITDLQTILDVRSYSRPV